MSLLRWVVINPGRSLLFILHLLNNKYITNNANKQYYRIGSRLKFSTKWSQKCDFCQFFLPTGDPQFTPSCYSCEPLPLRVSGRSTGWRGEFFFCWQKCLLQVENLGWTQFIERATSEWIHLDFSIQTWTKQVRQLWNEPSVHINST